VWVEIDVCHDEHINKTILSLSDSQFGSRSLTKLTRLLASYNKFDIILLYLCALEVNWRPSSYRQLVTESRLIDVCCAIAACNLVGHNASSNTSLTAIQLLQLHAVIAYLTELAATSQCCLLQQQLLIVVRLAMLCVVNVVSKSYNHLLAG